MNFPINEVSACLKCGGLMHKNMPPHACPVAVNEPDGMKGAACLHCGNNPAETLTAVLRVLRPNQVWHIDEIHGPSAVCSPPTAPAWKIDGYLTESKDDLARVVAMLTDEQRRKFNGSLSFVYCYGTLPDGTVSLVHSEPSEIITAPASVWLSALADATGVEAHQ